MNATDVATLCADVWCRLGVQRPDGKSWEGVQHQPRTREQLQSYVEAVSKYWSQEFVDLRTAHMPGEVEKMQNRLLGAEERIRDMIDKWRYENVVQANDAHLKLLTESRAETAALVREKEARVADQPKLERYDALVAQLGSNAESYIDNLIAGTVTKPGRRKIGL